MLSISEPSFLSNFERFTGRKALFCSRKRQTLGVPRQSRGLTQGCYVAKSSGATLPIVHGTVEENGYEIQIDVRQPDEDESDEAFILTVGVEQARIVGNSPLAALYGAYEFLEQGLGVRWYLPGPLGEVVPEQTTLVLPRIEQEHSPSFPMRWVGNDEWMLRNKQNRCRDGFWIDPKVFHTQAQILPHQEYFPERPDFFALIDGKRSDDPESKLCYASRVAAHEIARNMAARIDGDPDIDRISFSPTDGQGWCECDRCRAMDETGVSRDRSKSRRSLLFYNAIADELSKTHPDARILVLVGSYNVYNGPPRDASIRANPMLDVIITHYNDYCLAHPVPDPTCPPNVRYAQLIEQWQALGCQVYFYEYYWKLNWLDLPWPIVHSVREDIPWYERRGAGGVYTQYTTDNIWSMYPAHYVAARLLWDAHADADAIVRKMLEDLFGGSADHIKAYYGVMERRMAECGEHFPGRGLNFGPAVFAAEVQEEMRAHYEAAVQANQDEMVARRLAKIGTSLEYVERLMACALKMRTARSQGDGTSSVGLANSALAELEDLMTEIRDERDKWDGVVSVAVIRYLGREVRRWRRVVSRMEMAPAGHTK